MSSINQALVDEFRTKAGTVNAVVQEVPDLDAALQYVVDVCAAKSPCELLADEPGTQRGPNGPNGVPTRVQRIVAAPCLDEEHFARLSAACEAKGFLCLKDGLRSRLAGIDVGFSMADFGVAASATYANHRNPRTQFIDRWRADIDAHNAPSKETKTFEST